MTCPINATALRRAAKFDKFLLGSARLRSGHYGVFSRACRSPTLWWQAARRCCDDMAAAEPAETSWAAQHNTAASLGVAVVPVKPITAAPRNDRAAGVAPLQRQPRAAQQPRPDLQTSRRPGDLSQPVSGEWRAGARQAPAPEQTPLNSQSA